MVFREGDIYKGEFLENAMNGFGELLSKTGRYYRGYFLDGTFHGRGKLTW